MKRDYEVTSVRAQCQGMQMKGPEPVGMNLVVDVVLSVVVTVQKGLRGDLGVRVQCKAYK